jgi:polyferredoxin
MNPILLTKLALWIITIGITTWLLAERRINKKNRLLFLIAGIVIFGFIYGQLSPLNPNPMSMVTNLLLNIKGLPVPVPLQLSAIMLLLMLLLVIVSNRSICGWGCQLGLLQDALHRIPSRKVNVSKQTTFWTRLVFFIGFFGLLFLNGVNVLGLLDPFSVFQLNLTVINGLVVLGVALASVFFYRPWCRFLCPFGLLGLVAEQVSFLRPRIDEEKCVNCMQCVEACPTGAMKDFYEKNQFHNDCYACGACIEACKIEAIKWSRKKRH